MATLTLESPVTVGIKCPICGAEEPLPWFEQPMNETIREYARTYISPVKTFNTSLLAELEAWGLTEGLEDGND